MLLDLHEWRKEDGRRKLLVWNKHSIHATTVTTIISPWNKWKTTIRVQIWRCKDSIPIQSNPTEFKKTGSFNRIPLDKRMCGCMRVLQSTTQASLAPQLSLGLVPICWCQADWHYATTTFPIALHLMSVSGSCQSAAGPAQALLPQKQRESGKRHGEQDSIWLLAFF